MCRGQGLDRIATADVIQDSWMSVARGLASFRSQPGAGAFRAWLHQIVRRRIADYRRKDGLRPPAVGGSSFAMRVAEQPYESSAALSSQDDPSQCLSQSNGYLQRAMATVQQEIEPKTWQAFWLCVVDQRSTDEVAHQLAITPANVRQCRSRVLRRCVKRWRDCEPSEVANDSLLSKDHTRSREFNELQKQPSSCALQTAT